MTVRTRCRLCRSGVVLLVFLSLLTGGSAGVPAQQTVTSATLTGRVEDQNGASVVGASLVATHLDRNQAWTTTSDGEGRYRFANLVVGPYEIKVEQSGFTASLRRLVLMVGQTVDINVKLQVAGVSERVEIAGDVPLVEAARTQITGTIVPREIDALPLNGRNYLDLALLVPGVSRTNTGSNQRFAETSAVPGTGISIAGQRNLNNSFVIDGLSSNDDAAGLSGSFYSQEVIREFQAITSGGIAEYGRASGGVVNIITQSGANQWRGKAYGFLRNQRLDARNPLARSKDPLTQEQYGATIGGPIVKDRTFFFTNFEQTRENRAGFITIRSENVTAINRELDRIGYQGRRIETGEFPTGQDSSNLFARIDHRIGNRNQLAARYNFYDISSANSRTVGGLNSISRGSNLENRDQTLSVNNITTISPRIVNDLRLQYTRSRLQAPVNDEIGPAINISGVASFGTATFSPLGRDIDLYEVSDSISTQKGKHATKAGLDYLHNRVDILFPGAFQGVYTFSSLDNLQAGRYINFQQAFGRESQFQSNPNLGMFVQTEWRVRPTFTVNAGLRYDLQWLPDPIATDMNNVSPRLGIAYSPGDRRTVIRAGAGVYYDRIPLRATSNALQRDGINYKVAVLSFGQPGAPVFPNVLPSFPANLLTSITSINPEISNSSSYHVNLQVERQLDSRSSVSVAYLHLRGLHLIMSRNVNVPTLSAADAAARGIPNLGRPDPNFANIGRFESTGDSYYDGMTVSFNRRAATWASVRVSYTLSKAIDTAGNFFFSSPQNNFDIRDERGLSDNDQRHRLTVSGLLESRARGDSALSKAFNEFQLSYIFTYESGYPFTLQTGTDRNFDTSVNDRPVGVGRNTGKSFDFSSLDLRLSRRFSVTERVWIEGIAEMFNTLNRTNFQLPNRVFGPGSTPLASFGQPTAAGDARQVQFGLRVGF